MTNPTDLIASAAQAVSSGQSGSTGTDLNEYLMQRVDAVGEALPRGRDPQRFVRLVTEEIRRNYEIVSCRPDTIVGAMMLAAQLDLEPGGPLGQCFFGVRTEGVVKTCQFQMGYKGLVQLAGRSGITLQAMTVREANGDVFEWEYGTEAFLRHKTAFPIEGEASAWYAVARFADSRPAQFTVIDEAEAIRAKLNGDNTPGGSWDTHFNAMAEKTAAHRLSRWLPLSTEAAYAVAADGAVVSGVDVTVEAAAESAEADRAAGLLDAHGQPMVSTP